MKEITLNVEKREETGRKIRKTAGTRIPAVVYGHGFDPVNVWVETQVFGKVFEQAGMSSLISVSGASEKPVQVLIHDYQLSPVGNTIEHVDLFHVRMDEEVETHVPIVVTGESAAVKNMGGTLNAMDSITVRALPGDLPHEISLDISVLATFDEHISVSDLSLGDKVSVMIDEGTTIASVTPPRTQEEVDATNEEVDADVSKVEGVADKVEGEEGEAATEEEKK